MRHFAHSPNFCAFTRSPLSRSFADVVYDKVGRRSGFLVMKEQWTTFPSSSRKTSPVRDGDVLFVRSGLAEEFARDVLPTFGNGTRFVLVTHNGDEFAPMGVK